MSSTRKYIPVFLNYIKFADLAFLCYFVVKIIINSAKNLTSSGD